MLQVPWLLTLLNPAMLDQAADIIVAKGSQRLPRGGIRQEDRFTSRAILTTIPLADNQCIDKLIRGG
jgi:hypothetical protein